MTTRPVCFENFVEKKKLQKIGIFFLFPFPLSLTFWFFTLSQTTNFRFLELQRPTSSLMKMAGNVFQIRRKHHRKGRNCLLQAISPFPTLFQKICTADTQKQFSHYHTMPHFDTLEIYSFRKHYETMRNCFLLFSQCFLPNMTLISHFKCTLKCRLQFVSSPEH